MENRASAQNNALVSHMRTIYIIYVYVRCTYRVTISAIGTSKTMLT